MKKKIKKVSKKEMKKVKGGRNLENRDLLKDLSKLKANFNLEIEQK